MTSDIVIFLRYTEILLGLSLCIQTLEFLWLRNPLGPEGTFAYSIQGSDLAHATPAIQTFFGWVSRDRIHLIHLIARFFSSVSLMINSPGAALVLFLFLSSIVILIRWRGAFNGGSDFMTIVVLTGLLIARVLDVLGYPEIGQRTGLLYIAIQASTSYFISGWVKSLTPDWQSGRALTWFLNDAIFGPLNAGSLFRNPRIAQLASWAFILWEGSIPFVLLDTQLTMAFCATGVIFHFLVFWYFGLNRFFFAWIAAYPSLIYLSAEVSSRLVGR